MRVAQPFRNLGALDRSTYRSAEAGCETLEYCSARIENLKRRDVGFDTGPFHRFRIDRVWPGIEARNRVLSRCIRDRARHWLAVAVDCHDDGAIDDGIRCGPHGSADRALRAESAVRIERRNAGHVIER